MKIILFSILSAVLLATAFFDNESNTAPKRKKPRAAESGMALASWHSQRSFPGASINMALLSDAWAQSKNNRLQNSSFPGLWEAIGPMNFGGRTLCLWINPQNNNTIFAGSASGGLWKSYSAGNGAQAWQQVPTGFPVLGVAAIAVNPTDTNEMFIGTGEVYNDQNTGTGFAIRTTRGTYGIGILKSSDGGLTWSKSLDWQYDELKGVQDILINPVNPATVFAATTEGTYRSFDSGGSWTLVQSSRMATDLLIMPGDTNVVFIAAGNSNSANAGIYRSTDGGSSFTQVTNGITSYTGKAMLDVCQSNPQVLYASIANQLSGKGLYRSMDSGLSWTQVNSTDYQTYQGWYSHDVTVNPDNANEVMCCGIDTWKSDDGGLNLYQKSYWYHWDFNATIPGDPEGSFDYVHADVHRMYRDPLDPMVIYFATDGGIFRTPDGGDYFESCNGGYHTQQFYANFSCSTSDSLFSIGGLQDNATAVYEGNPGWRRVVGGDGLSTAINPLNDQEVYGSSQYLNVEKSTDKAQTFTSLTIPGTGSNPYTNFAGPFVLCPSSPNTLYGGRDKVYKSVNGGNSWLPMNGNNVLDSNAVLALEVSTTNANLVYAATAPVIVPQVGLFKTINGGASWTNVTAGIPNRYIMDIEIDPVDNQKVYTVLSGFGTPHLFRTTDGGQSWSAFGSGLPDVPANTITIDPLNTSIIYLGNDIGIYVSIDGGLNWQEFNDGLTDASFVMDISISPSNRKLRLATHGKGVYERAMLPVTITSLNPVATLTALTIDPNPAKDKLFVNANHALSMLKIYDSAGRILKEIKNPAAFTVIDISRYSQGVYYVGITGLDGSNNLKKFLKN
jgi:hypothetical protein